MQAALAYVQCQGQHYPWLMDKLPDFSGNKELHWIQQNIDKSGHKLYLPNKWYELCHCFSQDLWIQPMHVYQFYNQCLPTKLTTTASAIPVQDTLFACCMVEFVIDYLRGQDLISTGLRSCLSLLFKVEWLGFILYCCYSMSGHLETVSLFMRDM